VPEWRNIDILGAFGHIKSHQSPMEATPAFPVGGRA